MATTPQYPILGSGELWFARFTDAENFIAGGERYIGNTTDIAISAEAETLDHFDADHGYKEKDDSVTIRRNWTGSFTTDNFHRDNLQLFLSGANVNFATTAVTAGTQTLSAVFKGLTYQIGASDANPSGLRTLTSATVKKGVAALVLGTDYEVDLVMGRVTILSTSITVVAGDDLTVEYVAPAQARRRLTSGKEGVTGVMRFISFNPQGAKWDYFFPWVKITPSGDLNLKGDEWLTMSFDVELLRAPNREIFYVEGRA